MLWRRVNTNHHLSKPAMVGKLGTTGTFDVVWRSISPIKASVWSRYLPIARNAPPIGRIPGFVAGAPSLLTRTRNKTVDGRVAGVFAKILSMARTIAGLERVSG
jgi:hypothetical protein